MSVVKTYSFPEKYQGKIAAALEPLGFSLKDPKKLATAVVKLSDLYQSTEKVTPWEKPEFMAAYLAYFFPLNYMRNLKVFDEISRFTPALEFSDYVDYGFGLGSAWLAARDSGIAGDQHKLFALDVTNKPLDMFSRHIDSIPFEREYFNNPHRKAVGVFSYSLNELKNVPPWFYSMDTLVILEPSTSLWGRKLMEWRQILKDKGYFMWAPCTHQLSCPLLIHSKRDWCHDRLHWEQPQWFQELEKHLPMKNRTLTYSYLVARRQAPAAKADNFGRIVGDELVEKGKNRWLFCRGEAREFLSWLTKNGEGPHWNRGELLEPEIGEIKGNELRILNRG